MAKQTSIITLNGKIGGISFYKTKDGYQAREKGGVSKSRIMTDPRYARTRENMQEFAENASAAKLLKDAIRPAIVKISDPKLHIRLTSQMMKVLKSDLVNSRGNRKVRRRLELDFWNGAQCQVQLFKHRSGRNYACQFTFRLDGNPTSL